MELKDIYKEIENNLRNQMILKHDMKDIEVDIKDEYAQIKQFTKKDGTVDPNMVKFGEVKSAMDKHFDLKPKDALGEKYENREMYLADMRRGESDFPLNKCKSYNTKSDAIKEQKGDFKEIESRVTSLEDGVSSEEFKALSEIAKEIIKKEDAIEKDKRAEERGEEVNSASTESKKAELEELKEKLAKQLGLSYK